MSQERNKKLIDLINIKACEFAGFYNINLGVFIVQRQEPVQTKNLHNESVAERLDSW